MSTIRCNVTFEYAPNNSPVLRREGAGLDFTPQGDAHQVFDEWKKGIDSDIDHSPVMREMLRQLVSYEKLPQCIFFEKVGLEEASQHQKWEKSLPHLGSGADIWDRHKAQAADGRVYYDYVRRGHQDIRLIGEGQLL